VENTKPLCADTSEVATASLELSAISHTVKKK